MKKPPFVLLYSSDKCFEEE